MNIIIVGCGKVGSALAEQLSKEDNDVTIVDLNYELVQDLSSDLDIMGVVGSGSNHQILEEAGIEKADLLIAVTGSDELNLLSCLIAKKAGNCQTIARVRNPEYSRESSYIKEELGLAMVINPELAAANEIARLLRFPSAIKIETFAKGRVELLKFRIQKDSVLHEMEVKDIITKLHSDVLVCAVERGDQVVIPTGNFELREKDIISIVAMPKAAAQFFKKIKVQTDQVRDAMIVGGSKTAFYLTEILLHMGIDVKIIEKDRKRCEVLSENLPKATIICADAVEPNLLIEEGLEETDSFVALTNLDEENVLLSLFAQKRTNAKVVTKVNGLVFDEVIDSLDLDTTIYPKYVTSETIVGFVRAMKNSIGTNIETLYRLVGDRVEALEFKVTKPSAAVGVPLERMRLKKNMLVACIYRDGRMLIPRGQDEIQMEDHVIVVTTNQGLNDLTDILED